MQELVRAKLRDILEKLRPSVILSGMAQGTDQWAAEEALKLGIPFIAIMPFKGQESHWPPEAQAHYRELLSKAQDSVYVSSPGYMPWKMQLRNQWLVDQCDLLVAVWDGSPGGTANCVAYAERVGRYFAHINPHEVGS